MKRYPTPAPSAVTASATNAVLFTKGIVRTASTWSPKALSNPPCHGRKAEKAEEFRSLSPETEELPLPFVIPLSDPIPSRFCSGTAIWNLCQGPNFLTLC